MRIRMLAGVSYKGDPLSEGQEYDVDDLFGAIVVQEGRAVRVIPAAAVIETREPQVRHRDPAVKRAPR